MDGLLKQHNLGFFMTEKMSLGAWARFGMLSREVAVINELAKSFRRVFLFTYKGKSELKYQEHLAENVEIVYKNIRMRARDYRWLLAFIHWRKIRQCQILRTNQFRSKAALIIKFLRPRVKLVLRSGYILSLFYDKRGERASKMLRWWEKVGYRKCDVALVTSKGDKQYIADKYRVRADKIKVVANYIETNLFKPMLGVEKHNGRIIYVGRLDPQKNIPLLLKALAGTGLALDIAGWGLPKVAGEEFKESLLQEARSLDVELKLLGTVPNNELPALLNQYRIFVLPSRFEGMPKALLEAMSSGLACVVTGVSGSREVIEDRVTGLVSEANPTHLRQQIEKLLGSPELQEKLRRAARAHIVSHYSLCTQINKELDIYERLMS